MNQAHRRFVDTSPRARKRGERLSYSRQRGHSKGEGARTDFRNLTFHSELRGHLSGLVVPSYMLQDPTDHRKHSSNGYHEGSEETDDEDGAPSVMDARPSYSKIDIDSIRLRSLAPHNSHLSFGSFPASEYPSYIVHASPSLLSTRNETDDLYSALSAGPSTTIAIDAETGRPVRILAHATSANSHHMATHTHTTHTTSLYASAHGPSSLSSLHGGISSSEFLQRKIPALATAAEGHNTLFVQRPGGALPLYITDPLAPSTDLGRPCTPPQDPYSFGVNGRSTAVAAGSLEELVACRRFEEQSSSTALLRKQKKGYMSHDLPPRNHVQEQHRLGYHPLMGNIPDYQLFQSLSSVQQHQQSAHRRSLPMHNGSILSTKYDAETDPRSVVQQDMPDPKPGEFPAVLFCEADEERLTSYQCLLRKQLELFEADMEDVRHSTRQGRTAPIKFGQVGVRCRHCAGLKISAGTKGASYYSQTIDGIYQVSEGMSQRSVVIHHDCSSLNKQCSIVFARSVDCTKHEQMSLV
jgi:hypothetical protein